MTARRCLLLGVVCLCFYAAPLSRAYPTSTWPFQTLAQAPVIATATVEQTTRDSHPAGSNPRVVTAHATLRVLRSFPQSAFAAGDRIRLDYEALPTQESGFGGPDVPQLKPGYTVAFPLKLNPQPSSAPWRLIADEGQALVIPAIASDPPFSALPADGRGFLLHEIASVLLAGTRPELLSEATYISAQNSITADLMTRLESKLAATSDRWTLIAAAYLSAQPIPRPTVADLRANNVANFGNRYTGSLIVAVLQKLGPSQEAKENLIHQLLVYSDLASWGVGMTVPEFAQEPALIRELHTMLKAARPGALLVARDVLIAGQKDILADAITLSFHYISTTRPDAAELQQACSVIRDFGTDEQFGRFLAQIRDSQYRDKPRYDELWRNTIWSDNDRERAVLDILLKDDRIYQPNLRYSDLARGELTRLQARKK
jgi:hypothetical protein